MESIDSFLNINDNIYDESHSGQCDENCIGSGDEDGCCMGSGYGPDYDYARETGSGSGFEPNLKETRYPHYPDYHNGMGFGDGCRNGGGNKNCTGITFRTGYDYYGIKTINGHNVYIIDDEETIIYSIHHNYAIGALLYRDLTMSDCYIANVGNYFAHGETLDRAFKDAQRKYDRNLPKEERIKMLVSEFKDVNKEYPCSKFYKWHGILTDSCESGRKYFAKEHGVDIKNGVMTIAQFISLTENSYHGEIIKELREYYKQ